MFLRQGHEQVAGSDDLVDRRDARDAVGQGRDGLGAAHAIDLVDPQFVAGGQQVGVVGAKLRGRCHDRDLLHAGRLSGHGGHQDGGRIGRGPTGNADADPAQRHVTLGQHHAGGTGHLNVLVQNGRLELHDVCPDAPHGLQELTIHLLVGRRELRPGTRNASAESWAPSSCSE